MKKVLILAVLLLVSIAFVATGFAQEKAAPAPEKAAVAPEKPAPEKAEAPMKAEKPKPKPMNEFMGEVTRVDLGEKILMAKDKRGSVTFDLTNAKMKGYKSMEQIKAGDKVFVKYTKDGIMIKKMGGKMAPKKAKEAPAPKEKE